MKKTIVVCGYGTGISHAVARKFSAEGFQLALVARDANKLARPSKRSMALAWWRGHFPAISRTMRRSRHSSPACARPWVRSACCTGTRTARSLETSRADLADLRANLSVGVLSLVSAVQLVLPDLREAKGSSAILITGGGYALHEPQLDKLAAKFGSMGLAVTKAAQHKLSGVLHHKLKDEGIYVDGDSDRVDDR